MAPRVRSSSPPVNSNHPGGEVTKEFCPNHFARRASCTTDESEILSPAPVQPVRPNRAVPGQTGSSSRSSWGGIATLDTKATVAAVAS